MPPIPQDQVAGVYHRRVGDILVTALHDGHQDAPLDTLAGVAPEEAAAMLRAAFRPVPRRTQVQAFLIRSGDRTAIVDAGLGPMRPTVGKFRANLAAAGVAAEEVDSVLMTHLHRDHVGGLMQQDGAPVFANAAFHLHEAERAYWRDDATMAAAADERTRGAVAIARAAIDAHADRLCPFTGGEVFPGIIALPLPGHTPGHTGFLVASGGHSLLIWGDIVHVPELQVPRPEVGMMVDVDRAAAAATRRRVFDQVATDRLAFAGMHLHFPAFAHLAREGSGYRLVPDAWSIDLAGDAEA